MGERRRPCGDGDIGDEVEVERSGTSSAAGQLLERSRLEAVDDLAQARHALLIARERTPAPDGGHALPRPEADERARTLDVAEKHRRGAQSLLMAPVGPLAPAANELG